MTEITMNYGETQVTLPLAGAKSVTLLEDNQIPPIEDLSEAFRSAVEEGAVQSAPLKDLISSQDLVTIVVSDLTRFWMRQDFISALLVDYLHEKMDVPYDNMVIVVALGTHRPQTEDELKKLVSPEVYDKVRVENHDCMAPDLCHVGTTAHGTEVWVNKLAVGRKLILIGGTVHHLMAGFGGGRKSIVPGIAGKSTINQNHIHSLDPIAPQSNPLIGTGKLEHNPVNEDMDEAAALVSPTFGLNVVVNSKNQHCALIGGHWLHAWEKSCTIVQQAMGVPIARQGDVVIVSCGGYPKDLNLYQGVKSLLNAAQAVREGGTMIFLAECREGGGAPEFFDWIAPLSRGELDSALRANFTIAGYIFYASCEAIAKCDQLLMLTEIPQETVKDMKITAFSKIEDLNKSLDLYGKDVILMPFGGYTVPFLEK